MDVKINLHKSESGPVVFMGKRGLTPNITAGDDGTIYVDGKVLTESVKKAVSAANAAADAREKERVDKINQADSMIFQTEKSLKDLGDKLPADKKSQIEDALAKLKDAHQRQDVAAIDVAMKELETVFHAASQDMYNAQQQASQAGPQPGAGQPGNNQGGQSGDNVTDVPFEEVK